MMVAEWMYEEGRDLAKHFGCKFIETSAKQRINVDEAFSNLVREIRKYNKVGIYEYNLNIFSDSYVGTNNWTVSYCRVWGKWTWSVRWWV
jgi:hypothetical protein